MQDSILDNPGGHLPASRQLQFHLEDMIKSDYKSKFKEDMPRYAIDSFNKESMKLCAIYADYLGED